MVDNADLLIAADNANDLYAEQLIAKAKAGEQLRQEDIAFLLDYRAQKNQQIANNDGQSMQQVDNASSDINNLAPEVQEGIQAAATSGVRKQTAQDKIFANKLAKIGPIANVSLTETGDTPALRLALDVYGFENVSMNDRGDILVKPKGQKDFLSLPREAAVPSLTRAGLTAGATALGEFVGSPFGIPGVAAGAGLAGGASERFNVSSAANEAVKLGLVQPDEKQVFDDAINQATLTGGTLGAIFGGGVPVLKGMVSAGSLKKLPSAIRKENQTISQEAANFLRRFGVGGKSIQQTKSTLRAEQASDRLMREFEAIQPGTGGSIARKTIQGYIDNVNSQSDNLFNEAIANTESQLLAGNPIGFANITNLYNAFEQKLLKEASANDRPEVIKFLNDLKNELNFTKQQVATGQLPVQGVAAKQFMSKVTAQAPLDTTIFGPGKLSDTVSQSITPDFDPTKFTARDFHKTKNFIKDELTNLDNPKYILDKKSKKNITQFLKALEKPFTTTADEATDIAMQIGLEPEDLIKGNELLKANIAVPKGTQDFQKVAQGYKIRQQGFQKVSPQVRKIINQSPTDAALEDAIFEKSDYQTAKQIRGLIDEFGTPEDQTAFTTSVKAKLFNPPSSSGKKQIQRRTQRDVSQETIGSAAITPQELKAFQAQGGKPTASEFGGLGGKSSILLDTPGTATVTELQGNRAANILEGYGSSPNALLGSQAANTLQEAQLLSGLQSSSGVAQSAADLKTPGIIRQAMSGGKSPSPLSAIGSLLGETIGAGIRPAARIAGDVLEGASYFSPAATISNIGGYIERNELLDSLLGNKKRR